MTSPTHPGPGSGEAKKKRRWRVSGRVTGSKFAGVFEADSAEEAMSMAEDNAQPCLCHQCSDECEDPEFEATDALEEI